MNQEFLDIQLTSNTLYAVYTTGSRNSARSEHLKVAAKVFGGWRWSAHLSIHTY